MSTTETATKPAAPVYISVVERFTFKDGVRLALVTWCIGDGERRCVVVRECQR